MLFLEAICVHKHGRTVLDTGETCPVASSLGWVSAALDNLFAMYGRNGEWSLTASYNNPCRSALVADYERCWGGACEHTGRDLWRASSLMPSWLF